MADKLIARYAGPLHGVVLRQKEDGTFLTRCFNTRPELGWCESEYEGNYDMSIMVGAGDFFRRVKHGINQFLEGDLRVCLVKEMEQDVPCPVEGESRYMSFYFDTTEFRRLFGLEHEETTINE